MTFNGSPEQWRDRLATKLQARVNDATMAWDYYRGDPRLPTVHTQLRRRFKDLLRQARRNWAALIVDCAAERLEISGFRLDGTSADSDAWAIWQGNGLDAESELVHLEALVTGRGPVSVWPDPGHPAGVRISPEMSSQVQVAYAPDSRRQRVAALKTWHEDGVDRAWLYLPEAAYLFERPEDSKWSEVEIIENPLGAVPIVELRARPGLDGSGRSELAGVIDQIDAINSTIFQRLLAAEFSAFRQRWVTGMDIPVDPATDQPVEPFKAAIDRIWMAENPEAKFGEFAQHDLTNYIRAAEAEVQHLAAITRTPPHYLLGGMVNISAEALRAAEAGLVSRVRRHQRSFGEGWEEVMRLALAAVGHPGADNQQSEVIWANTETRSDAEKVDAAVKLKAVGLPDEYIWEFLGLSPQQIARIRSMSAAQLLTQPPPDPVETVPPAPGG